MNVKTITYDIGIIPIQLSHSPTGWHYDGPASCGPRHVRLSGNGPAWRGPISNYFARELQRRLAKAGYSPS